MKMLLIALFIVLFVYLVVDMCRRSGSESNYRPGSGGLEKSHIILDGLLSLEDRDLYRLKRELLELDKLFEKTRLAGGVSSKRPADVKPARAPKKGRQEILQRIRREIKRAEAGKFRTRGSSFSKARVILIQILLILITILMVVL